MVFQHRDAAHFAASTGFPLYLGEAPVATEITGCLAQQSFMVISATQPPGKWQGSPHRGRLLSTNLTL